jgi:hypothetical protein
MIATLLADKYYSNPGYGTSELNSNIDSAYDFWINTVVDRNPRLDDLTKAVLRGMGQEGYSNCKTLWPFWDDEQEASCFWSYLRANISSATNDPDLLAILTSAEDASADVADPPDSIINQAGRIASGEDTLQIPWWLYAAAALSIYKFIKE